jgi:nucleoside-diphosphate-sugar epimerase
LPDVHAPDTTAVDWQGAVDLVRSRDWGCEYSEGRQVLPAPLGAAEFPTRGEYGAALRVRQIPEITSISRPFDVGQIDFDMDLRELQGQGSRPLWWCKATGAGSIEGLLEARARVVSLFAGRTLDVVVRVALIVLVLLSQRRIVGGLTAGGVKYMAALKVLFIGGTGIISSACSRLALERGVELHLLKRTGASIRPIPEGAEIHLADVREPQSVRDALGGQEFDVVVDWVAFTPEHVATDVELFSGRTGQYVFISSASAYQTPPERLPVTESTPLSNPYWAYSRQKIASERHLFAEYRNSGFPVTVVRPSHTYDATTVPFDGGWTVIDRMRRGEGVVVHGDGTSLWTITHHEDFARGFLGLLAKQEAIGEAFHITSDESPTWNSIYSSMARAAGVVPDLVHVPSDAVMAVDEDWGAGLLGDKAHSMVFDNAKIRNLVPDFTGFIPFEEGARQIVEWYDAHPEHKVVDERMNALMDKLVQAYRPRAL